MLSGNFLVTVSADETFVISSSVNTVGLLTSCSTCWIVGSGCITHFTALVASLLALQCVSSLFFGTTAVGKTHEINEIRVYPNMHFTIQCRVVFLHFFY